MKNISAFDEAPASGDLSGLLAQALELVDLEAQIKDLEQLMKQLAGRANELKTQILPDKMAEVGLSEFKTPKGDRIKIEDFVSGSLPKDVEKRKKAIDLITSMGGEGIIRNELLLSFEKSQHNEAMALADDLRRRGFPAEITSGIHPQTYLAFVRERLRNGEEVDSEALGIFVGRKTKVELAK